MRTGRDLTTRELEVVAAWWHEGTVVGAAKLLGIHEQTAKNILHTARLRAGALNTLALARMFEKELPSMTTLKRRRAKKAA